MSFFPYFFLALGLALSTCGPRHLSPASPLDTPTHHYERGLARLEAGDLIGAQREFERAGQLDPDFAGAQVGQALIAMRQKDFWRARQEVEKAIHQDGSFADAHIALGRIVTAEGVERGYPTKDWLKEALAAFGKAAERDPGNPAVDYYQGLTYLEGLELSAAREAFLRVLEYNRGPWVGPAQAELEKVQVIERAAPGSQLGLKIARMPQITRAELAVLLLEELKLGELIRQRRLVRGEPSFRGPQEDPLQNVPTQAADIATSWARPWIEEVLALGVSGLELFPDHTFQPAQPVTRADYALVTQGILVLLTGDPELATRYIGEPSRFPDVRGDFYAYNAIALNAERGIITADQLSGRFRPDEPVSGPEALLIIRQLQTAVRMEF